jgi:tRNA A37 threonylcarbamoyladenosine modification protein TsaB
MRILAIDTATEGCSVSLSVGDRQLDRYVELERGHAEQILPMVREFRRDVIPVPLGPELVGAEGTVELPGMPVPWAAAGRGLQAWPALAERCRAAGADVLPDLLPRAAEVLALARHEVAAGRILEPADALPVYVRDNVAEVPS